jgi:hypothetical protein
MHIIPKYDVLLCVHPEIMYVAVKKLEILPVPYQYVFSLMNFFVNNQTSKQIRQYTVLIQGISTIFIDQLPTYLVFRKVLSILTSEF